MPSLPELIKNVSDRSTRYRHQIEAARNFSQLKPFVWLVAAPSRAMFEDLLNDLALQLNGHIIYVCIAQDLEGRDPSNTGFVEIADGSVTTASIGAEGEIFNHAWCHLVERVRAVNRSFPYIEIEG